MAELYIYESGSCHQRTRIWPATEPVAPGAVQEAREYIFELLDTPDPLSAELYIDDERIEALRPRNRTTACWRWQPGFYAGFVPIRLELGDGQSAQFELISDPDMRKMTRDDFDRMVSQVLEDTHALFSLSGFRTGIARGTGEENPPLARLEFLRSRISQVESAVLEIARHPIRDLKAREETLPHYKAHAITPVEIMKSFRAGRFLREPGDIRRLPRQFNGWFPEEIRKNVKTSGLDTKEHQDIKACLRNWSAWMNVIAQRLGATEETDPERKKTRHLWAGRCRELAGRLERLLRLPLFSEVTDRTASITITPVYRQVFPYRKFFLLYRDISLGISRVFGDFLQMPLARTFDLYEIWCFLRLLRSAVLKFNLQELNLNTLFTANGGAGSVTVASGNVNVRLNDKYSLSFKRSYREYWVEDGRLGSFSRTMVPDISVGMDRQTDSIEAGKLIVLDSKYRIRQQLNDAVSSIHMYRDALVEEMDNGDVRQTVVGAYLLSPEQPEAAAQWKSASMPARLFHPQYRSTFRFGAVTLHPRMTLEEVGQVLETVLRDAGAV
ncbi:DUF2357 domain-containing protein [Heliobacterium undosum]|uniref:DUF2357 domain-containing protein n=1 Tax=Heliomicrobium undosum TaxID=121734 RepID=A0A845L4Z7_9FIRM|nr:DUF2357 domain-containing protein [Heliomicrobium undosum]MZP31373.1 DUF2357 domain-containing protein [Heliomicrobium undosum]